VSPQGYHHAHFCSPHIHVDVLRSQSSEGSLRNGDAVPIASPARCGQKPQVLGTCPLKSIFIIFWGPTNISNLRFALAGDKTSHFKWDFGGEPDSWYKPKYFLFIVTAEGMA